MYTEAGITGALASIHHQKSCSTPGNANVNEFRGKVFALETARRIERTEPSRRPRSSYRLVGNELSPYPNGLLAGAKAGPGKKERQP